MESIAFCRPLSLVVQRRVQRSSAVASSSSSVVVDEVLTAEELFQTFLRDRQERDFVSRVSDKIWSNELAAAPSHVVKEKLEKAQKHVELTLRETSTWSNLDEQKLWRRQREKNEYRRSCLLEYEALKRELSLMTLTIGVACSLYCAAVFSVQAAVSYGVGVTGSLLYMELISYHVDRVSEDNVPQIFVQRRGKRRLGITSKDLTTSLEKYLRGILLAISSPRLLIPVSLYALWLASNSLHEYTPNLLQLEIAPMMVGFFVYKAAAIVQVYRENKDLLIAFPDQHEEED